MTYIVDSLPHDYRKLFGPSYLPETVNPDHVADAVDFFNLRDRPRYVNHRVEIMTDQIDVFMNGKRIATYMA